MKSNSGARSVRVALKNFPLSLSGKDRIRAWSGAFNTQFILTPRDPAVAAATAAREPIAPRGVDHGRDLLGSHVRSQGARPPDRLPVCLRRKAAHDCYGRIRRGTRNSPAILFGSEASDGRHGLRRGDHGPRAHSRRCRHRGAVRRGGRGRSCYWRRWTRRRAGNAHYRQFGRRQSRRYRLDRPSWQIVRYRHHDHRIRSFGASRERPGGSLGACNQGIGARRCARRGLADV